ncbi:MAG TPA: LLM class F420-dependent oxidoreductase [Solirubrobacterales bacterium]|nr:LLM class F420-dependent oxidoreductase [Solirubrobacterales bacterium]
MDFGLTCFLTEDTVDPVELGTMAEQRGFESLLLPEHTHIPSERVSVFPGGDLPDTYSRIWDPFVAGAMIAARTERLRVGTAICLVAEHDPIVLAKEIASLDRLSGGRFLFGVGAGWNLEEVANHGVDPVSRFAVIHERVEAMRAIWSEETASYKGDHVGFEAIWCRPKPAQQPGPPVLVGGNGPRALERVLAYGDEWLPICLWEMDDVIARIGELKRRAAAADRVVGVSAYLPPEEAPELERLAAAGAHRAVFMLPSAPRPEVEAQLDALVRLRQEFTGSA